MKSKKVLKLEKKLSKIERKIAKIDLKLNMEEPTLKESGEDA